VAKGAKGVSASEWAFLSHKRRGIKGGGGVCGWRKESSNLRGGRRKNILTGISSTGWGISNEEGSAGYH